MAKLLSLLSVIVLIAFPARAQEVTKIRWVLAHEPIKLFERAAKHFAQEVEKKTNGKIQVEVLTLREYEKKYNKGKRLKHADVVRYLQEGKIEISQTYTTHLGKINRDMYVLDLPFLFRDHDHAQRVLEGQIGDKLLAGLEKGNIRGLAFTYSGGYRVIPSDIAIEKVDQFKGMKIRTSASPVAQDTFLMLGAKPVPLELEDVGRATKQGKIVAAESTYPRFYEMRQNEFSKVLNDTRHSLFLTAIGINKKFWEKLRPEQQEAIREAAISSARLERQESIEDAELTLKKCREDGIRVVDLPDSEREKFKTLVQPIYDKYKDYFGENLIAEIQKN